MKKVLLIALALVMVMGLASTSMAATRVVAGGWFEVRLVADDFEDIGGGAFAWEDTRNFWYRLDGTAGDASWSAAAQLGWVTSGTAASNYGFEFNDELFTLNLWRGRNLSWLQDPLHLIRFNQAGGTGAMRLTVPVEGLFDVVMDLRPEDQLGLIVDGIDIPGLDMPLDVGAIFLRKFDGGGDHDDTILAYGNLDISDIALSVSAGLTFSADDENLAYGVKANAPVTDEITLRAEYLQAQANFAGNVSDRTSLSAGARFVQSDNLLWADANYAQTGDADGLDSDTAAITIEAIYRLGTDTVAWGNVFNVQSDANRQGNNFRWQVDSHRNRSFHGNNDMVAGVKLVNNNAGTNVQVSAVAPFEDLLVAMIRAEYDMPDAGDADISVKADAFVEFDNISLWPYLTWDQNVNVAAEATTKAGALLTYRVGSAQLHFLVEQEMEQGEDPDQFAQFSVRVNF